jgi:hypothetical protein
MLRILLILLFIQLQSCKASSLTLPYSIDPLKVHTARLSIKVKIHTPFNSYYTDSAKVTITRLSDKKELRSKLINDPENPSYNFENLSPGEYLAKIEFEDFITRKQKISIDTVDRNVIINIKYMYPVFVYGYVGENPTISKIQLQDAKIIAYSKEKSTSDTGLIQFKYNTKRNFYYLNDTLNGRYILEIEQVDYEKQSYEIDFDSKMSIGSSQSYWLGKTGVSYYYWKSVLIPYLPIENKIGVQIDLKDTLFFLKLLDNLNLKIDSSYSIRGSEKKTNLSDCIMNNGFFLIGEKKNGKIKTEENIIFEKLRDNPEIKYCGIIKNVRQCHFEIINNEVFITMNYVLTKDLQKYVTEFLGKYDLTLKDYKLIDKTILVNASARINYGETILNLVQQIIEEENKINNTILISNNINRVNIKD